MTLRQAAGTKYDCGFGYGHANRSCGAYAPHHICTRVTSNCRTRLNDERVLCVVLESNTQQKQDAMQLTKNPHWMGDGYKPGLFRRAERHK